MAITYHGNLTEINRLVVEQVRDRLPVGLIGESVLTDVFFDSEQIDIFSRNALGVFFAPDRILLESNLYEQALSHYIAAHEQLHEIDHNRTFGRLGDLIPNVDLDSIFTTYYQAISTADVRTREIEGAATAFGLFYGTRPWALKRTHPQTFAEVLNLHIKEGGRQITHPEYVLDERIFRYRPGTEPYFGNVRLSTLLRHTGWENITVIRPQRPQEDGDPLYWRMNEKIRWDILINDKWDTAKRNVIVEDGDIIFRTVPEDWIRELNEPVDH